MCAEGVSIGYLLECCSPLLRSGLVSLLPRLLQLCLHLRHRHRLLPFVPFDHPLDQLVGRMQLLGLIEGLAVLEPLTARLYLDRLV